MNGEISIKEQLISIGAKKEDVDKIISDVEKVILSKIWRAYLESLKDDQRAAIAKLPEDEIQGYIKKNRKGLPRLEEKMVSEIHTDIWSSYIKFMKQQ